MTPADSMARAADMTEGKYGAWRHEEKGGKVRLRGGKSLWSFQVFKTKCDVVADFKNELLTQVLFAQTIHLILTTEISYKGDKGVVQIFSCEAQLYGFPFNPLPTSSTSPLHPFASFPSSSCPVGIRHCLQPVSDPRRRALTCVIDAACDSYNLRQGADSKETFACCSTSCKACWRTCQSTPPFPFQSPEITSFREIIRFQFPQRVAAQRFFLSSRLCSCCSIESIRTSLCLPCSLFITFA